MKKLFTLLAIMLLAGCAKEDYSLGGSEEKTISTFKAIVEDSPVTRAHFETETHLTWDDGDVIHVISDKQKDAIKFTHQGGGVFSGSPISYNHDIYAVYSPSGEVTIDGDNLMANATLNAAIVHNPNGFAGETFMVAKSQNNELAFKQTVGILKFSLKGTKHIASLTLKGNDNEVIAGTGKVDLSADEPIIVLEEGGSNSITMQTDVTLKQDDATYFYFQVPVISFERGFTLTIEGEDATTGEYFKVEKRTDNPIDIARGFIHSFTGVDIDERLQELFEDIEINPAYVPINWDNIQIMTCNPNAGTYSFSATNETKNIREGSVLTIMHDYTVDIVIVKSVSQNGGAVSVQTEPGSLNNIFANTSFTLSTARNASTRSGSSTSGRVFYPVKTIYQDSEGNIIEVDEAQTRALSVTGDYSLYEFNYDASGTVLHEGKHHKIYMEKSTVNAGLDLELTLSYGDIDHMFQLFTSKPDGIKAEMFGNFNTEQIFRFDVFGEDVINFDEVRLKKDIFMLRPRLFLVAEIVPIVIECRGDLFFDGKVSYDYNGSFYTGFSDAAHASTYVQWTGGEGVSTGRNFSNQFDVTYPTIEGMGEVNGKVHVFPRIYIMVDRFAAANLDIKPYLRASIKGGFKEEFFNSENDYCAWSFDAFAGFDIAGGIDLNIYKKGKAYTSPDKNVIDLHLYKSPGELHYLPDANSKIKLEEKNTLTFGIYDSIVIANKSIATPLPQLLKFESKKGSTVSSKYGIANKGKVTMDWYPVEEDDELYATLYNIDGSIIMRDTVPTKETKAEPYYVIEGNTLTFYYDDQMDKRADAQSGWNNTYKKNVVYAKLTPSCRFYKPESTSYMFSGYKNLVSISGLEYLDTSNVTDMFSMFSGCSSLTSLDVSGFDTSNVTDMLFMFEDCSSLTSLDVSSFDTSNVTDMGWMFSGCSSLTSLNVSRFNTSKVTRMLFMFNDCSSLTSLDVSRFNTSNVKDMSGMFEHCSSLTSLNLSSFNTSKVTDMGSMFHNCSSLTSLDVSRFNTSNVTDMSWMFSDCSSLKSLDLSSFNTSNVKYMNMMFNSCSSLTSLNVSRFNTSKVTDMSGMFASCSTLTSLNVSRFNTSKVANMVYMFGGCSSLTSLNVSSFNTSNVTDMGDMFYRCSSLKTIYAGDWNYINNSSYMFYGCYNLVGGQGSKLSNDNVYEDGRSAHIDGGMNNPGLFTE